MGEWSFEHAITTRAPRADAWAFWSDMRNHMRLEPGVDRIELDCPFVTGTTGRTVAPGFTHEWRLSDVVPERRFGKSGWLVEAAIDARTVICARPWSSGATTTSFLEW